MQKGSDPDTISYSGLGWKVKLQKRKSSHFITLIKELVRGNALKAQDDLYYYLIKHKGRNALILYLDGQERPPK